MVDYSVGRQEAKMLERQFLDLMAGVCASVSVVTTTDGEGPHGVTVSSLASVSLRPPLISIALDRKSSMLTRIGQTGRFGVNVLDAAQDDVARLFASRAVNRFQGLSWQNADDLPRLDGVVGWAACDLWQSIEAGDHLILLGLVTYAASVPSPPLVYGHRIFGTHSRFETRPRRPIIDHIAAFAR
jgi:flavin reductase (DIM6/NTAB) family NADH-FMN oxidoreductase RutF